MEYAYSIIMAVLSGALFIYAGLMALTKDYKILPYRSRQSVKPEDPEEYMTRLAKVIALVAVAPALSAIIGLWSKIAAAIVLVVGIIVFIWLGTKIMRKAQPK